MSLIRKPATALGWFPHSAATDAATIDMADARQVALRARLRNHYWLTECRPIADVTVSLLRRKMVMLNAADAMQDVQVAELLSEHFGFLATPAGLTIPDLDEHRAVAAASLEASRARASAGGKAKAEAAKAKASAPALGVPDKPEDF